MIVWYLQKHCPMHNPTLQSGQYVRTRVPLKVWGRSPHTTHFIRLLSGVYSMKCFWSSLALKFKSNNYENYNNPFSLDELTDAISKSHDTAVGPDDVHYQMLKHLPDDALLTLLNILNNIWASGKFPTSWCTSTAIPVLKPGKDTSDPSNYRPIALTSCICKVMERMINSHLVWYLEQNKLISLMQCGFRKQHSTTNHLVRLEFFVSFFL